MSFAQVNQWEESIMQCALALEVFCTMTIIDKKIDKPRIKRTKTESGGYELSLESTLELGATLGDKLSLLNENNHKAMFQDDWFEKAFKLNELRKEVAHSVNAKIIGKKIKIKPSKKINADSATKILQDTLELVAQ